MTTPEPENNQRRPSWLRSVIPVVIIIAAVVAGLFVVKHRFGHSHGQEIELGTAVPDFKVKEVGKSMVPASSLNAQVLMVTFWASWCEACVVEMPSIVKLAEAYKDRGFRVLAINVDQDPEQAGPKAARQLGIPFPIYSDPEGSVSELFAVSAIPFTVVLDKSRKVLFIETGERDWNSDEIRTRMEKWLTP